MKTGKLLCLATVLSLALSVPAFAGDIQIPTFAPPPPVPGSSATGTAEPAADESMQAQDDSLSQLFADLLVNMFWV